MGFCCITKSFSKVFKLDFSPYKLANVFLLNPDEGFSSLPASFVSNTSMVP